MNRVTMVGRLAADPELRSASSGTKVCSMRLAITRRPRGGEDQGAVFIDVVCFDGLAVACSSALRKGSKVLVDGRLEHRTWQARDGSKRFRHEVIAQEVTFLDAPRPDRPTGVGSAGPSRALAPRGRAAHPRSPPPSSTRGPRPRSRPPLAVRLDVLRAREKSLDSVVQDTTPPNTRRLARLRAACPPSSSDNRGCDR